MRLISAQILAQIGLAVTVIVAVAAAPPARGAMLAVSINNNAAQILLNHGDIRLRGQGPLPGSLIIDSQGPTPFWFALNRGILLLNANSTLCGATNPQRKIS